MMNVCIVIFEANNSDFATTFFAICVLLAMAWLYVFAPMLSITLAFLRYHYKKKPYLKSQLTIKDRLLSQEVNFLKMQIVDMQNVINNQKVNIEQLKNQKTVKYITPPDYSTQLSKLKESYELQKEKYDNELLVMKQEINVLNNQLIQKYYNHFDYQKFTSQDCKNKLTMLKAKERQLRGSGDDVFINYVSARTTKTENQIIRQMLRTFNTECDNIMSKISIKSIDSCITQIRKSFDTINALYSVDEAELTEELLDLKIEQAMLFYASELKAQEEKDIQKAIKEQMLEEAKAQKEIEEQKKKIDKDLQQHISEVNRLMKYMQKTQIDAEKQLYMDKIKELEDKIKLLEGDKATVLEREANAKAGFVYIISNIGSFGEDIYKIGMTRRLEPMDRIHELSSASVPFEFDVHAMIFSSDAPELETTLHNHFAKNRVNKVNPRKEFYNVSIDEIEKVVKENYNETVVFTKIPLATEYRKSLELQIE